MKMKHDRVFQFAKNMAEMSDFERQKMGCVVVYKNKIIGMGFNSTKSHPLQKEYNRYRFKGDYSPHCMHAEMHALMPIRHLDIDWSKVKVYTYRICREDGSRGALARPCISCQTFMKELGIRHIYYTTSTTPVHEILDIA